MPRLAGALAVVLLATGCGGGTSEEAPAGDKPGAGRPAVKLGTKNFDEQVLLGHLYAEALRAKGFKVTLKPSIGATEVIDRALTSGQIDLYPEYTGVIVSVVKRQAATPSTARQTYVQARAFERSRGFELLAATPFEDRDAIAVTKRFSRDNGGLDSLTDLRRLGPSVFLSGAPEFRTRYAGLVGLRRAYKLTALRYVPLPIGQAYPALDSGKVQAAAVFTTDGPLATGRYDLLADPKAIFGFQNVAPVVSQKILAAEGPEFAATLDAVSAKLTNEVMQGLNQAVTIEGSAPEAVAREFLRANGLA